MASTVPTDAGNVFTVLREPLPVTTSQYDVHAITAWPTDTLGGSWPWLHLSDVTSSWEGAVLAVLFLFIGGLVVLRLLESASDRAYVGSDSSIRSDTDTDTDAPTGDSDSQNAPSQTHSADTTDHQGYEHTLSPETPPKFLSDEGKVVRLLVANHGRIRQHEITDETGWSKSKVSRICSQMHADDTIEKRSIGRENIIVLSESTPPTDDDEDLSDRSDDTENPLA